MGPLPATRGPSEAAWLFCPLGGAARRDAILFGATRALVMPTLTEAGAERAGGKAWPGRTLQHVARGQLRHYTTLLYHRSIRGLHRTTPRGSLPLFSTWCSGIYEFIYISRVKHIVASEGIHVFTAFYQGHR